MALSINNSVGIHEKTILFQSRRQPACINVPIPASDESHLAHFAGSVA